MDIVPILNLKNKKILGSKNLLIEDYKNILERYKDKTIYLMDIDGVEKYKPNLCLYQKLMNNYNLWVDSGPRNLGDIVDSIMAGAKSITIRKNKWDNIEASDIKEISENHVYLLINKQLDEINKFESNFNDDLDGAVLFEKKEEIENDFIFKGHIKDICIKTDVYTYESDINNYRFWENIGIKGLLVPLDVIEEFNKK
jgi:hypothetical protein